MPDQSARAVKLAMALDAACEAYRADAVHRGIPLGATRIGVPPRRGGDRKFRRTALFRLHRHWRHGEHGGAAGRREPISRNPDLYQPGCGERTATTVAFRPVGDIVLKGRAAPLTCYEPIPAENASAPWMTSYLEAYRHMTDGSAGAITEFEQAAKLKPEDGPTRLHLKRLQEGAIGAKVVFSEK
ncbi:hypothetical protein [uncultured Roseibium sp.]|uniref:hypothetical protein n=1 Tax=uncultured Roseibium sp. TaxID=1936171 RepID=UPI003217CE31